MLSRFSFTVKKNSILFFHLISGKEKEFHCFLFEFNCREEIQLFTIFSFYYEKLHHYGSLLAWKNNSMFCSFVVRILLFFCFIYIIENNSIVLLFHVLLLRKNSIVLLFQFYYSEEIPLFIYFSFIAKKLLHCFVVVSL